MELLQLRYFQAIARFESVTQAAVHFGIPQPAMSQTLARLERDLGDVKLFDRRNKRLYLNENGRIFLNSVNSALAALDNGISALQSNQQDISGPIHLLVLENHRFVLDCVSKFAKQYPNVNFFISHDFSSDALFSYDLCISSKRNYTQMHHSVPLVRERIVLAVHENHRYAKRESVSLSELKNEKFITMPVHSSLNAITYDYCRACGFEPQVSFICDDPYFVRKYISQEMGIALAPSISWAGRFRDNTILLAINDPEIYSTSYLIWDAQCYHSPAVTQFRDVLLNKSKDIEGNLLVSSTKNAVR